MRRFSGGLSVGLAALMVFALALGGVVSPPPAGAVGREFVPLDHWAYSAVLRFEAMGFCDVPDDRPLTRPAFIVLVETISRAAIDRRLAARDRYQLRRLEKEFTSFASRRDPQARYDPPTFFVVDRPVIFEGDFDATVSLENALFDDHDDAFAASNPRLKLHYGDRATYDTRYRFRMGPERGDRSRNLKPSPREKSFKGLTSLYELGYLIVGWDRLDVFAGRVPVDWGPADDGNLITPGARLSIDQVGARITLKNVRLSTFQAQLSPEGPRYLAGHRLEARWRRLTVGLNESVVYAGKQFDPVYALPLSSFYANQFNERGDDNVMWSLDAKLSVFDRVVLYGDLLIDDYQFERDGVNPDKLAADIGTRVAVSYPLAATVSARYRIVDAFTYSHKDSATAYVAGRGDPSSGDALLGSGLGPDADDWRVDVEVYPAANAGARVALFSERRGEANDLRAHVPPDDPYPPFPLGVVQRSLGWSIELEWELDRNSRVGARFGRINVHNAGNVDGFDDETDAYALFVSWDF